jgi:excisionase family DNA binding protein
MLSLREAAELSGTSKSSVFRAIKSGRLSATRTDQGEFRVDPAEVMRAYAADNVSVRGRRASVERGDATPVPARSEAESEVLALRTEVRLLREMADDLKAQRDKWQQQAERLALTGPVTSRPRRWWPWRRST